VIKQKKATIITTNTTSTTSTIATTTTTTTTTSSSSGGSGSSILLLLRAVLHFNNAISSYVLKIMYFDFGYASNQSTGKEEYGNMNRMKYM
jgi:Predicted solute binding protein